MHHIYRPEYIFLAHEQIAIDCFELNNWKQTRRLFSSYFARNYDPVRFVSLLDQNIANFHMVQQYRNHV